MILYYAPGWWMRIAAACTPFSWDDVMGLTREKLGRKRKIRLPSSLVIPAEEKARRTRAQTAPVPVFDDPPVFDDAPVSDDVPGQMTMEEMIMEKPEE